MSTPTERRGFIARAIETAIRVSRDGGVAQIQLPHAESGTIITVEIDQAGARERLGWLLDRMIADLWQQISEGKKLTAFEWRALADWTAATVADAETAECERQAKFSRRRVELYLIKGDKS
jgi:hypothetical protein